MLTAFARIAVISAFVQLCSLAFGQHLWWDHKGIDDGTAIYGEITVLSTETTIYYCGANWHPGEAAGGYCGIQHNSPTEKRTIFSIWDTSPSLHPSVTFADPATVHGRFGGEGEGGHTHMVWNWKLGETFQFYVRKHPSKQAGYTDADYFVFDRSAQRWLHSATITSPIGEFKSVATIAGGIASFLENFSGQNRGTAKLATYNLWLGHSAKDLKRLVTAGGDGIWGELGDAYFLAEGSPENLRMAFEHAAKVGRPIYGGKGESLPKLKDRALAGPLVKALSVLDQ